MAKTKLERVEIKIVWKNDEESEEGVEEVKHYIQTNKRLLSIENDKGLLGKMVKNPTWPNK